MLVLQQLFSLSNDEAKFQINDRQSFENFVGLGVINDIIDAIFFYILTLYVLFGIRDC